MQCVIVDEKFGLENLKVIDRDIPKPKANEVLINIKAASLNYRDYLMATGKYNPKQKLPYVPCSDGAGVIVEVGPLVKTFKVDDEVMPIFSQKWLYGDPKRAYFKTTLGGPLDGTLSQYMCVPEESVVLKPKYLSFEEAATLPCAALTAWSALVKHGKIQAADTVLTLGTGGVSIFALQIAKMYNANIIATSSSETKIEKLKKLGASYTINYRKTPNWHKEVFKITKMIGVDHVIEVGGAGTLEKSIMSVRAGGQISLIGILSGSNDKLNLLPVLMRDVKIQGVLVGHKHSFENMLKAMEKLELKPVIDKAFDLEDSQEAFNYLKNGKHFGKVIIKL